MRTWKQWLEENELTLPQMTDAEKGKKADTSESSSAMRNGFRGGNIYPPAYRDAQYPDAFKLPYAGDIAAYNPKVQKSLGAK